MQAHNYLGDPEVINAVSGSIAGVTTESGKRANLTMHIYNHLRTSS